MQIRTIAGLALAALALSSCSQDKAGFSATVNGLPDGKIIIKQLEVNSYSVLDTVKTDAAGCFDYRLEVKQGQPEFVYLFHGDKRIAALLLESGDRLRVTADTLGNYDVSGSAESEKLAAADKEFTAFLKEMLANMDDDRKLSRIYIDHYRKCVKYVMENAGSLTVVPVLFERLNADSPIFSQPSDAILFRNAVDSLAAVYPDSRYVKALRSEADRRFKIFELNSRLATVSETAFPDLDMPDIRGERKSLAAVGAKAILVHFWANNEAAQNMLAIEVLRPLYDDYHSRGFEIYSVCINPDKADWGATVSSQKLPWINVNDGLGTASPSLIYYNVSSLPMDYLIVDGELSTKQIKGEADLRKELDRVLGRR